MGENSQGEAGLFCFPPLLSTRFSLQDLTVKENLVYSAFQRLEASSSRAECHAVADAVINMLCMGHVKDSMVGDICGGVVWVWVWMSGWLLRREGWGAVNGWEQFQHATGGLPYLRCVLVCVACKKASYMGRDQFLIGSSHQPGPPLAQ